MDKSQKNDEAEVKKLASREHHFLPQTPLESHEKIKPDDEILGEKPALTEKRELRLEPNEDGSIIASEPEATSAPKPESKGTDSSKLAGQKLPPKDQPSEEELARKENIEKLIAEKTYFLPINNIGGRRSKGQFILSFCLVFGLGSAAIYLLLK